MKYSSLSTPRLPGRTPMAIMRRYRRLMRTEAERPVVREVDQAGAVDQVERQQQLPQQRVQRINAARESAGESAARALLPEPHALTHLDRPQVPRG